jgi:hypothetical protein
VPLVREPDAVLDQKQDAGERGVGHRHQQDLVGRRRDHVSHGQVVAEDHPVQVQADANSDGQHRRFAEEIAVATVGVPDERLMYYVCSGCHALTVPLRL